MSYRDLSAALARVDRLEAEIRELGGVDQTEPRRAVRWLDVAVFGLLVIALAAVILVGSWLYTAP